MSRYTRFIITFLVASLMAFSDLWAATPPSSQARFIGFNNITSTSVNISFVKGNGQGRVIVISTDATVESPVNGTDYSAADGSIGNAVAIANGDVVIDYLTGSDFTSSITGLTPGTTYHVQVFEYNTGGTPTPAYNTGDGLVNPRSFTTLVSVSHPSVSNISIAATTVSFDLTDLNTSPASDGYLVTLKQGGTPVSPYDLLDISTPSSFEITDLTQGTAYELEVKAYIGNAVSDSSYTSFTTTTDNTPPQLTGVALNRAGSSTSLLYTGAADDSITIVLNFNEPMKTWLTPTLSFSPAPTGLSFVTGSWNTAGTIYTAQYDFTDENKEPFNGIDVSVTTTSVQDLAGNDLSSTAKSATDVFSLDTKEGVLSNFNYDNAGTWSEIGTQPRCKSGVNGDVVEVGIDLSELGYNTAGVDANNFTVFASDASTGSTNQIVFSSTGTGNTGTYLFTATLDGSDVEDYYNMTIIFTDEAGNETNFDMSSQNPVFRIDNTDPVISDVDITNATCASRDDVVFLTFNAADTDGCGTFDQDDIQITNNASTNNPWVFFQYANGSFTYTLDVAPGDADGARDVTITATDSAGNVATNTTTGAFTIDNTEPEISNVQIDNTCANGGDELTLTFDVVEAGCGTFDKDDITIGGYPTGGANNGTLAFTSQTGLGNTASPYEFTYTYTVGNADVDGNYTFTVNAHDDAGNNATQGTASQAFTVDNTVPAVTNVAVDNTCANGGDILTLTFDVVEAGCGTFDHTDITVDDDATTSNNWTYISGDETGHFTYTLTLTASDPDGLVSVTIDATDDAGNTATQNTGASFTIDNTAPLISNLQVDKACVKDGATVTLTFDVAESGCGTFDNTKITVADNSGSSNSWVSQSVSDNTYTYTLLIAGNVNTSSVDITVNATDDAGNVANTETLSNAFAIDNTAPTVGITNPIFSHEVNGSKVIDFTANDVNSCGTMVTEGSVNGGSNWHEIESGISTLGDIPEFGPLSDGAVTLSVRTTDGAGNVSATANAYVTKDATPPTITSITPAFDEISKADDGFGFDFTIVFNEGMDQTLANDPIVTITANNTLPTTNTGGSWSDDHTYLAYFNYIDAHTTPEAIEDLDVSVSGARDDAEDVGNLMATDNLTGVDNFSIDTEDPLISFDNGEDLAPAESTCVSGDENVYYTASDKSAFSGLDYVEASINTGSYETVTSGFTLSSLTDWSGLGQGAFTLHLKATDNFGNTTDITRTLNKDDVAPDIDNLLVNPGCAQEGDEVTIAFDVTEAGCGTFDANDVTVGGLQTSANLSAPTITGDGSSGTPYHFTYTYTVGTSDSDGPQSITVNASDDAGNTATQATGSFNIDNEPPDLLNLVTSSTAGGTPTRVGGTTTTLTISFDVASDNSCSTFDPSSVVYTITGPDDLTNTPTVPTDPELDGTWTSTLTIATTDPDGDYHISISATDDLGNPSNILDPAGVEFVVDNTAPSISFTIGVNDSLNRASTGPANFYLQINFNEEMNNTVNPTYDFFAINKEPDQIYSPATVAALVESSPQPVGAGWQTGNTGYRIYFDVDSNSNVDMRKIPVNVSGGQDIVGNVASSGAQSNVFSIDMITPYLNDVVATPTTVTNNNSILSINFEFSEKMDIFNEVTSTEIKPTISFPLATNIDDAISIDEENSEWSDDKNYKVVYIVHISSDVEYTNVAAKIENITDAFGNPFPGVQQSNVFSIDTKEPVCVSVSTDPDPAVITTNNNSTGVDVTVVMDQSLDNTVVPPTIGFGSNTNLTASVGTYSTTTNTNDTYTFTVTHSGTEEDIDAQLITIAGLKDLSGNPQIDACSTSLNIDTDKPDISSLTVSDDFICSTDEGETLAVVITYDEPMDNTVTPNIAFDTDIVSNGVLTSAGGSWNVAHTIYTANYLVDGDVLSSTEDVSITVSGAKDVLGNVMNDDEHPDLIDVDTYPPTVTSVAFAATPSNLYGVNRSNIGTGTFTVTINYDEEMDPSFTPSVSFTPTGQGGTGFITDALTNPSGSWNTQHTVYTVTYDVADASVFHEVIYADVDGAKDLCGNPQDPYSSSSAENFFSIDLIAPTISFVGTPAEGACVNGDEAINFFAFDISRATTVGAKIGTASYASFSTGSYLSTIAGWSSTSDGAFTVDLKATDIAGNETVVSRSFNKDVTAPVISNIVKPSVGSQCVNVGDYYTFDFDATDNGGCGTFDHLNIAIAESLANDFEFVSQTGNTFRYRILIDGSDPQGYHDFTIIATDDVGNTTSTNPPVFDIDVDKTAPVVTNISVDNTCVTGGDLVTLTFNITDNGYCDLTASNITINDDLSGANTWQNTGFGESLGVYTATYTLLIDNSDDTKDVDVSIDVTDVAGNSSTGNVSGNTDFSVDNAGPTLTYYGTDPSEDPCLKAGDVLAIYIDADIVGCAGYDPENIVVTINGETVNDPVLHISEGYYFTLLIDENDVDGAYNISFDLDDNLGNSATTYSPTGVEFYIDNTAPVITINDPTTNDNVNGSKVLDIDVSDASGCGVDYTEVSVDSINWTGYSAGVTLGDISQFSGLSDGAFTLYVRSYDVAGNKGTASVSLIKDTQAPTVTSAVASDNMIAIADNGSAFSVAVNFSEGMNTGTAPTVTLTSNNTVATTNTGGSWNDSDTYTATFGNIDAITTPEEIAGLDVTVAGAIDNTEDIGNLMTPQTINDVFDIDTKAPTCSTMTNNNSDIYENDKSVNVSILFSEVMASTPAPTFTISGTTHLTAGSGSWSGNTFTQAYTHDGTQEETTADFSIDTGAPLPTDLAGNTMLTPSCTTSVDIDTKKPTVASVTFNPTLVTSSTTSLTVTVVFDEDMQSTIPGINFNATLAGLVTNASSSQTDSKTFVYTYTIADANLDVDNVTIGLLSGKDVAGNTMAPYTSTASFDVDQVSPTITAAHIESDNSVNNQYARVGHSIDLKITTSEELDINEFTGNIAGYSIVSIDNNYSTDSTYTLTVEVQSGVSEGLATFSIGYKDLAGNSGTTLTSVTDGSSVTIDVTKPVGTIAQASGQADPTGDSPINFAVTFTENVTGLDESDFGISGATTVNVTGSGDTYNVAVSDMTSSTVTITLDVNKVVDFANNNNATTIIDDNQVTYNVSGASIVEAGSGSAPTTLSSLVDTQGEAVMNFDFKVTDDGTNPGADALATKITSITISQGTGNDISYLDSAIAGAELTDGTNTVTGTVYGAVIEFTGLAFGSGQIGEVVDNGSKTYTLKVWLRNDITIPVDNQNLVFSVNRNSFSADGSGSSFSSGAGTNVESGSTNNSIDVDATKFTFTTIPTTVELNTNTTFALNATDVNGNKDADYSATSVTLTPNLSTISSGGSGAMSAGTLTLSAVQFSVAAANDYVTASDGTISGTSGTFNIRYPEPLSVTNLAIVPSQHSFQITYSKPDTSNTLLLAKKVFAAFSYGDESGMDNETNWSANTSFGTSASPANSDIYVIYAGRDSNITMTNLDGPYKKYSVIAYSYNGTLNSAVQNFNETETFQKSFTIPKEVNGGGNIDNNQGIAITHITPHPVSVSGNITVNLLSIEEVPLTLELYDSKGAKVMTVFKDRTFNSVENTIDFIIPNAISSGTYFLRLNGNGQVVIAPLTIVK